MLQFAVHDIVPPVDHLPRGVVAERVVGGEVDLSGPAALQSLFECCGLAGPVQEAGRRAGVYSHRLLSVRVNTGVCRPGRGALDRSVCTLYRHVVNNQ